MSQHDVHHDICHLNFDSVHFHLDSNQDGLQDDNFDLNFALGRSPRRYFSLALLTLNVPDRPAVICQGIKVLVRGLAESHGVLPGNSVIHAPGVIAALRLFSEALPV